MSRVPGDDHYRTVAKRLVSGTVVPFLGAGVNLCDRPESVGWALGRRCLPSGRELAAYLAEEIDYPYRDRTDLLRVSQYFDITLGNGPLYKLLRDVFTVQCTPTPLHRLLASLPEHIRNAGERTFPLILTTNYDDVLERAFVEAGESYDLVTYIADGRDRGLFKHTTPSGESKVIRTPNKYSQFGTYNERPVIVKVHGAVCRRNKQLDSFVVTENQYISYLHNDVPKLIPVNLLARMRESHFLFLGYSLRDWNLRVILHRVWADDPLGYHSWAVQLHPDKIDEGLWAQRDVELLDVPLERYVEGLVAGLGDWSG